jgi:DNA modification methylase
MCGDSFDKKNIDKLINNNQIHCVYTDPPYGMNLDTDFSHMSYSSDNGAGKKIYKKVEGDNKPFDPTFLLEYFKDIDEIFLWGANYYADKLTNLAMGKSSWFVWNKRVEDGKCDYSDVDFTLSEFELCWSKTKHRQRIINAVWFGYNGLQYEGKETFIGRGSIKRIHPNQKPVRMIKKSFEYFLKENHKNIVDLFGGSGSVLIACEETGRNCFMMEYDEKYCEDIINRYIKYKQSDNDVYVIRLNEKVYWKDIKEINVL